MVRASGRLDVGEFMVWATGRLQGDGIMGLGDWQAAGGWDHGCGRLAGCRGVGSWVWATGEVKKIVHDGEQC